MATNFPTSKQSIPNPSSTDLLENATAELDHDYQHSTINDTVEALQDKVGVDGSAVNTTHDYKLSGVADGDKAVSLTGTETLTNKTLSSPVINLTSDATGDTYYRSSGGAFTRLPIGSTNNILSVSATGIPEWISNPSAADASTTVKGVVEEATQAEVDAGTAAGGTSARLFVNPSTVRAKLYHDYAASTSGNDTYVITVSPAPTAYTAGDVYVFEPDTANTGAATLNVNSLGAKTIVRADGSTLADGDIQAGGIHTVVYDGTNMILQNPFKLNEAKVGTGQTSRAHASGTGTQNIAHGLGVTPRLIKITAMAHDNVSNASGSMSVGTATGTGGTCTYFHDLGSSGGGWSIGQDSNILNTRDSGGLGWTATISAVDSTNITLNFTKADSGVTIYLQWEAIA